MSISRFVATQLMRRAAAINSAAALEHAADTGGALGEAFAAARQRAVAAHNAREHGDASAYWPDAQDPHSLVHGRDKCEALRRQLFAMKLVAWLAYATDAQKLAVADVIHRRRPDVEPDFVEATHAAIGFTKELQQLLEEDLADAATAAAEQSAGAE